MSAKRWFVMLGCIVFPIIAFIAALNMIVDPFSVFGDKFYSWHSYGMTWNPKTAKYDYLNNRIGEFDAFIIGPSGASSISPSVLEGYTGLRWYNTFNYGADMEYTKRLADYIVKKHRPQQILLCLPVISADAYDRTINDITYYQPLQMFWRAPFLFADSWYASRKIDLFPTISYFQQSFDSFVAETGEYDKTRRDAESIGSIDDYLAVYPEFVDPWYPKVKLEYIDECAAALAEIVATCQQYGTKLTIVTSPILADNAKVYDVQQVNAFYERITQISEFWDFSLSSVSHDPRYYYDTTHFRNSVGDMMLARIFSDGSVYIPEDFGIFVTRDNAADAASLFARIDELHISAPMYTAQVPVLLYRHISDEAETPTTISPGRFEEHIRALYEAGYTALSLMDLCDYVYKGRELPERPVVITFDDGYLSVYTEAFPVLQRYGYDATVFITGAQFKSSRSINESGLSPPYLGVAEAIYMHRSGLISVQSQSYSMNRASPCDQSLRENVLQAEGETENKYIALFRHDFALMAELIKDSTGEDLFAFAYPNGVLNRNSATLLREQGILVTFSTDDGINTLIKGLPQSLHELKRLSVTEDMTGSDILNMVT